MISKIAPTLATYMGYFDEPIKKMNSVGEEQDLDKTERVKKILEEDRKKVQPVYNAKGQLIEYDEHGRHLDIKA